MEPLERDELLEAVYLRAAHADQSKGAERRDAMLQRDRSVARAYIVGDVSVERLAEVIDRTPTRVRQIVAEQLAKIGSVGSSPWAR